MTFFARSLGAVAAVLIATAVSAACPFCGAATQLTLTQEAAQAALILFGTPSNPVFDPNATLQGTTDLQIETVIKSNPIIEGKKVVTINRYIPVNKDKPQKFLVFCDVYKDKLDPYMGMPVDPDSKVAEYLKGAMEARDKDATTRLKFFFKYLDSSEMTLSEDAYREFAAADYKDYRPLAEKLDPDLLTKWLKDPNTPASRFGLYGSMLGHCGKPKHAKAIREMLDDPDKRFSTGIDGMFAGYVMIEPKEAWAYISDIFKDSKKEFLLRYAALRAARFLADYRPDLVTKDRIVDSVAKMLDQDDIADLVVEDLRKWQCWQLTDKVLALRDAKTHQTPIIQRAILRFALQSAETNKAAAQFVAAERKADSDRVKEVEELLQLELAPKSKPATVPAAGSASRTGAASLGK